MKYTPKPLRGNVNVSPNSPAQTFFILLTSAGGILVVIYIVLGFCVDLIVPHIPPAVEQQLAKLYSKIYANDTPTAEDMKLQEILDGLVEHTSADAGPYTAHLVRSEKVNAMALPGGHIVVYSGLANEAASENELAFILGHELGHFANHDHLSGLGRNLVLLVISTTLFGQYSEVATFFSNTLTNVEMQFSQKQERAADRFALTLVNKRYGHVGGALGFFQRLSQRKLGTRILYFFSSHPYPADRVAALEKQIRHESYSEGQSTPLDPTFIPEPENP